MINLELYRFFLKVAETGKITRASEELNISQPAVTKQIKNLEEMLGGPLFIRTKKGMKLNEAGEKLFIKIKQALLLIDEAEKEFKNFEQLFEGTIKIGTSTTLVKKFLATHIKTFHNLYPNIIIEISTDPTTKLIESLNNGIIDFIISKLPSELDKSLDFIMLDKLENIFIVGEKYKNLKEKSIIINELIKYPLILQKEPSSSRRSFNNYCKENKINIIPAMNIASSNLLIDFVKAGYGVGFVSKLYVNDDLFKKEIFELKVVPYIKPTDFGIIKSKKNILSFCSNKFLELIIEETKNSKSI